MLVRATKGKFVHIPRNNGKTLCGKEVSYKSTKGCEVCGKCLKLAGEQ